MHLAHGGVGAFCTPNWFSMEWPTAARMFSKAVKELIPVVIAAAVYSHQWQGHVAQSCVDNYAVLHIIHSSSSECCFLASHFNFLILCNSYHREQ